MNAEQIARDHIAKNAADIAELVEKPYEDRTAAPAIYEASAQAGRISYDAGGLPDIDRQLRKIDDACHAYKNGFGDISHAEWQTRIRIALAKLAET